VHPGGLPTDGTVLDPFAGAFTTALVAQEHGRNSIGIELNPKVCSDGQGAAVTRENSMEEGRVSVAQPEEEETPKGTARY